MASPEEGRASSSSLGNVGDDAEQEHDIDPAALAAGQMFGPRHRRPQMRSESTKGKLGKQTTRCPGRRATSNLVVTLKTSTWASDSHGLFDYESRNLASRTFKCSAMRDSYLILRVNFEVVMMGEEDGIELLRKSTMARALARLFVEKGALYISPASHISRRPSADSTDASSNCPERLWIVARSVRERSVRLTEGDVVKLGRYRLRVRQIVASSDQRPLVGPWAMDSTLEARNGNSAGFHESLPVDGRFPSGSDSARSGVSESGARPNAALSGTGQVSSSFNSIAGRAESGLSFPGEESETQAPASCPVDVWRRPISRSLSSSAAKACRICLSDDEDSESNPLVAPCRCSGSMQFVHLKCLRQWIEGRLNIKPDGTTVSFFWRNMECELCKEPYPSQVSVLTSSGRSKQINLFSLPQPQVPYIMLEPESRQSSQTRVHGVHVISLAQRPVAILGRGHESDVRLADISVSRLHALLKYHYDPSQSIPPPLPRMPIARYLHFTPDGSAPPPQGCFVLEDHRSKFGTLLELRGATRIITGGPGLWVQVGRTVLTICVKRQWRNVFSCWNFRNEDDIVVLEHPAGGVNDA